MMLLHQGSSMLCSRAPGTARGGRSNSSSVTARVATPFAPAPISDSAASSSVGMTQQKQAHAAFQESLERVVVAHKGAAVQQPREHVAAVGQLALQSSSASRLLRQTHLNTLNMSSMEEHEAPAGVTAVSTTGVSLHDTSSSSSTDTQLPLSQLAFKALLRASLAAARLHHGFLTTPHLLAGIIAAAGGSNNSSLAMAAAVGDNSSSDADSLAAAAEAAVVQLIDGPRSVSSAAAASAGGSSDSAAAAATASAAAAVVSDVLLGRACGGLADVVSWVPKLSDPARSVLLAAEGLRKSQGHKLLTTNHILAALLSPPTAGSSTATTKLLQQLGYDVARVSASASAAVTATAPPATSSSSSGSSGGAGVVVDEDGVLCEPLGFLHEEFYGSLCAELLLPTTNAGAGAADVAAAAAWQFNACLN